MSVQIKTELLDENEFEEKYNDINYSNNIESVIVKQEKNESENLKIINVFHVEDKTEKENDSSNNKFIRVRNDVYENSNNNIYKNDTFEDKIENENSVGLILNEHYSEASKLVVHLKSKTKKIKISFFKF